MKPFLTLLLESFRGLKSQWIFWITMGLSALVALVYLSIGFDDKGMSLFFGLTHFEDPNLVKTSPLSTIVYMMIFTKGLAGFWLTWVSIILALVSCAPIYPNTMTEGGAGMVMTKGVSRLQIFIAKFVGSLFFVLIQVSLFMAVVMIAFKWRLGDWNFSLLWYVPAILLVFASLYAFQVLIAVKTRSALTALILTVLVWALSSGLGAGERALYMVLSGMERGPVGKKGEEVEDATLEKWYRIVKAVHTPFPKNAPIMDEAENKLVFSGMNQFAYDLSKLGDKKLERRVDRRLDRVMGHESKFYSIWSSFLFALVALGAAAWSFCRREY